MTSQILCLIISTAASSGEVPLYKKQVDSACKNSEHVIASAKKYGIDPLIIASLILVESGWKRKAVSYANACGLTQVLPKYSKYTCTQLKNPKISIKEGVFHLSRWIKISKQRGCKKTNKHCNSNLEEYHLSNALACYNVGNRCLRSKQGRKYSKKVLDIKSIYDKIKKSVYSH